MSAGMHHSRKCGQNQRVLPIPNRAANFDSQVVFNWKTARNCQNLAVLFTGVTLALLILSVDVLGQLQLGYT